MEETMGKLYIIPTPIGNLEDITLRSIRVLKEVDYILAEDTRHSSKFLNHYEIKNSLVSYYKEVENIKSDQIIEDLKNNKNIALISDAGMPGISDPGEILIKKVIENNLPLEILPGPSAFVLSIVGSGFSTSSFMFYGFLKEKKSKKTKELESLMINTFPVIIYESPFRIKDTLEKISEIDNNRLVSVSKELTKIHEEYIRGLPKDILENINPKGEFIIVIDGAKEKTLETENLSLDEHYEYYKNKNFEKKEIIKKIAKDLNVPKNDVYMHFNDK